MAEINQNTPEKQTGRKVRVKRQSTKVDMTPMVDLAFLLLTFFILTTSFNEAYMMKVTMPDKVEDTSLLPRANEKDVLNLVLAEDNKVYWWIGLDAKAQATNYSKSGIRKILLEGKNTNPKLMVLIKPKDDSKFENIVDVLDEMEIVGMIWYSLVDFTDEDQTHITSSIASCKNN